MRGVAQTGQKACKDTHNGHGTGNTASGETDADRAAGSDENGQNLGAGQLSLKNTRAKMATQKGAVY